MKVRFDQLSVFTSFRDPLGNVLLDREDVWRLVSCEAAPSLKQFLQYGYVQQFQLDGKLIPTRLATSSEAHAFYEKFNELAKERDGFILFKHDRVEFPSFPYEWSPAMLFDAGKLTLEVAVSSKRQTGWSLKDATPFNILFAGTKPIFIDVLSFEERNKYDPIWLPYNQFVQTFVLPLLINKETRLSMHSIFLSRREGIQVSEAAMLLGGMKMMKPGIFSLVTAPHLLSKQAEGEPTLYTGKTLDSAERAQFILDRSFARLEKQLHSAAPDSNNKSVWSEYTTYNQTHIPEYMSAKQEFVDRTLNEVRPETVLDVGCNTGLFSLLAAKSGARVVAIDYDESVVDRVYRAAKEENADVLPLVVNLSRPTPRMGWRYSENPSFLDRALGQFDLVLMLAVIHHMLVQERIPLSEILRLAVDLTKQWLVVEFVPPSDKMFKSLARGRDHLHKDLTAESFEESAGEYFHLIRSIQLPDSERRIYLMKKK